MRRIGILLAGLQLAAALVLPGAPATARTFFSFGFGIPLGVPYPAYPYPPPVYAYPPPAYYYPPPPSYEVPYYPPSAAASRCHAGAYVCPIERGEQAGDACSCPTNRGRAWGRAGH